jgi:hypothetical protein
MESITRHNFVNHALFHPEQSSAVLNLVATGIFSAEAGSSPSSCAAWIIDRLEQPATRFIPASPRRACRASGRHDEHDAGDSVLARMQDSEGKVSNADQALSLPALHRSGSPSADPPAPRADP